MKNSEKKPSLRNRKLALETLESRELLAVGFSNITTPPPEGFNSSEAIVFNIANARQWLSDDNDYNPQNNDRILAKLNGAGDTEYTLTGSGNSFTLYVGVNQTDMHLTRTVVTGNKDVWVLSGLDANRVHTLTNYYETGIGWGQGDNDPQDMMLGTVPDAPAVLTIVGSTSNSLSVAWPISAATEANVTFELQWQVAGGAWDRTWTKAVGRGASTSIIEGLDSNVRYDVRIRAVNEFGNGVWSASVANWTNPNMTQFIRQPGFVEASATSITLSWTEIEGCSYRIEYTCDDEWDNPTLQRNGYGDGNIWGSEGGDNDLRADMTLDYGYIGMNGDRGGGYWAYLAVLPVGGNLNGQCGYITKTVEAGVTSVEITMLIKDNAKYYFDIISISEDSGKSASTYDSISVQAAPLAPTNFVTSSRTTNSITLIYTQPIVSKESGAAYWGYDSATITSHPVEYRKYGTEQWISNGNNTTVTGLESNTRYEFRVKAVNNGRWTERGGSTSASYTPIVNPDGGWSSEWTYWDNYTLLEQPQNFHVTEQTFNSIKLQWDTLPGVTKYTLQYKKPNDANWLTYNATVLSGSDTTATIGGLSSNTQYEFQIRAETTGSVSGWTGKVNANTNSILPTGFIATDNSITSISLIWNSLSNVTYTLQYQRSTDPAGTWESHRDPNGQIIEFQGGNGIQLQTIVSNLNSNTSYNFRLTAKFGTNSENILYTYSTRSLAAANLKVATTLDKATVTWDFLDSTIAYRLEYKKADSQTWITWSGDTTTGYGSGCVVPVSPTVLTPNTTYDFRVTSMHTSGTPEWVETTVSTKTLVPLITSLTTTATSATLRWESQALLGVESYRLEYRKTSQSNWVVYRESFVPEENEDEPTVSEYTIDGLLSNTEYEFRLTARKTPADPGVVTESARTTAIVVADSFIATPTSENDVQLNWSIVEGVLPTEFYGFKVEWKKFEEDWSGSVTSLVPLTPDRRDYTVTGLNSDTRYSFRLTLIDEEAGIGGAVTQVNTELYTAEALTFIAAPTGFAAERINDSQITVRWDRASVPSNCRVELQYRTAGATNWTTISVPDSVSTRTVSGMNIRTGYEFRIRNVRQSEVGTSGWVSSSVDAILENAGDLKKVQDAGLTSFATWTQFDNELRLTEINCTNRNISGAVDLSDCTELKKVIINNNKLTSLDLSGCSQLLTVDCSGNQITELNIDGTVNLNSLKCYSNALTFLTLPVFTAPEGGDYTYVLGLNRQAEIVIGIGGKIPATGFNGLRDLADIDGTATVYQWYDRYDELITAGITQTNGVFSFGNALIGQEIYCLMTNEKFPGLFLNTIPVTVSGEITPVTPDAPANFRSVNQTKNSVTLAWDTQINLTGYTLQYKAASSSTWQTWTAPAADATGAVITGLTVETAYNFRLMAHNADGDSAYSTADASTLPDGVVTPPAAPTNLKAEPLATRNVNLTWDAVTGATHYQIYWQNPTSGKMVSHGTTVETSFTTARVPNGVNTFYVYAWTDDVRSDDSATVTITVNGLAPPATPTNLKAVPLATRNVNLTWNAVAGATHYQVFWKNPTSGAMVSHGTTVATSFETARVPNGVNTFYVYAWADEVRSSAAATVTTTVNGLAPPAAPTNLKAEPLATRNVNLTWNAVAGATHYQVFWMNPTSGKMVSHGTTEATSFETARVPNGVNTFYVYAWADDVRSSASATVTTTVNGLVPPAAPTNLRAEPLASRSVDLKWTAVPGATHYQIYWMNPANGKMVSFGTTEAVSFKTARVPNGVNTFYVYAWADDIRSNAYAAVTATVNGMLPSAVPTNLRAEPLATRNVNLTWTAVPNATHYQIYWKNANGKMVNYGTTEATSFRTTRVPNGMNTFYVYAWADDVRSNAYAAVTTTVNGTAAGAVLRPLEAVFAGYSAEYDIV